jgi:hypothetical protein
MLTRLSYVDQQHASSATCALISDYDEKSIGEPDASAPPDQPRSIQSVNLTLSSLATSLFGLPNHRAPAFRIIATDCIGTYRANKQSNRSFSKSM